MQCGIGIDVSGVFRGECLLRKTGMNYSAQQ